MKRIVMGLLLVVTLLISAMAAAERTVHIITEDADTSGGCYSLIPGTVYLSERIDGKTHIEGRLIVQNTLTRPVHYEGSVLIGYNETIPAVTVIEVSAVNPRTVASGGYSLLTFSVDDEIVTHPDWYFEPLVNFHYSQENPEYLGVAQAAIRPYEYSAAIKAGRDLSDLPTNIYDCIVFFEDEEGRFIWAEDVTVNTENENYAKASLEDYEVELFRACGCDPSRAEIVVQAR